VKYKNIVHITLGDTSTCVLIYQNGLNSNTNIWCFGDLTSFENIYVDLNQMIRQPLYLFVSLGVENLCTIDVLGELKC